MTVPETIKLSEDEIERKIIEFQGTAKGQEEEVLDSGKLMEDLSIEDMKVSSASYKRIIDMSGGPLIFVFLAFVYLIDEYWTAMGTEYRNEWAIQDE